MQDTSEVYNLTISYVVDGFTVRTMSFAQNSDYDYTGGEPGELAELLAPVVMAWLEHRGWVPDFLEIFNELIKERLSAEARDERLKTENTDERTNITVD